jgi:prophage antirepressor-like protein
MSTHDHGGQPLMSTADVCRLVARTDRTIRNWTKKGLIQKIKISGSVYYIRADVVKLLGLTDPDSKSDQHEKQDNTGIS